MVYRNTKLVIAGMVLSAGFVCIEGKQSAKDKAAFDRMHTLDSLKEAIKPTLPKFMGDKDRSEQAERDAQGLYDMLLWCNKRNGAITKKLDKSSYFNWGIGWEEGAEKKLEDIKMAELCACGLGMLDELKEERQQIKSDKQKAKIKDNHLPTKEELEELNAWRYLDYDLELIRHDALSGKLK